MLKTHTHRCQHHVVYHHTSFGTTVLYESTHWCGFTPELLGSVRTNKGTEIVRFRHGLCVKRATDFIFAF